MGLGILVIETQPETEIASVFAREKTNHGLAIFGKEEISELEKNGILQAWKTVCEVLR